MISNPLMGLALQSKSVSQTNARQKYDQNVLDKLMSHIWDRFSKFNHPSSSSPPDILQSVRDKVDTEDNDRTE